MKTQSALASFAKPTFALVCLLLLLVLPAPVAHAGATRAQPRADAMHLTDLPPDAQTAIAGALGREDANYHFVATDRGYRADNPAHRLSAEFTSAGVNLRIGDSTWNWQLLSPLAPGETPTVHLDANRLEFQRGDVTEWYVNTPLGLEQGFILQHPRAPEAGATGVGVALALGGELDATLDADGAGLTLARAGGAPILRYSGLRAMDADGKPLRAWMEIVETLNLTSLQIRVDDAGARYPLTIDPWLQQAKLTPSDRGTGGHIDLFGNSVAVSGDTVVVGAPNANVSGISYQGAAYVFVKPGGGWANMTQTAKLTASDGAQTDLLGCSVAVSGDTVVGGELSPMWYLGAAYVFSPPAPTLTSISPTSAAVNAPDFTLTVTGTNFIATSSVQWYNGTFTTTLATNYSSATKLTATIPKSLLAAAGPVSVTVFNPPPDGNVTSNVTNFTIIPTNSAVTVTLTSSCNPCFPYQRVILTATITNTVTPAPPRAVRAPRDAVPTGTVTFQDNGNNIPGCVSIPLNGTGQAICTTALPGGTHTITALYSGDANFNPASGTLIESINYMQLLPVIRKNAP